MTPAPSLFPASAASARELTAQTVGRHPANRSRASRCLSAGARCLALATVACLMTRPLFRRTETPAAAHPASAVAAPVNVTEDIARRLTPEAAALGTVADGTLWAGVK